MKNNNDIAKVVQKLGFKWSKENTEFGEVILFEAPINDRNQSCIAKISKHSDHGDIVEVISVIGELEKIDAQKAVETLLTLLMLNQRLITAKTQVDQKGEKMYIVARTLAPSCTEKELETMIEEVSIFADVLEQELLGIDKS